MLNAARTRLPRHRRHHRLHELPRRRRARPRPGHPGRPHGHGRRPPPADVPAGQARGRRGLRLRASPRPSTRSALHGHHRADLLRVPPPAARHRPGVDLRLQRLHPDARPRPQAGRPPRHDRPAADGRPRGARRQPGHRRPPTAQERGRGRATGLPRLRAVHRGLPRGDGPRRPGRRSDSSSTARRTTTSARSPAGSPTSTRPGRRSRRRTRVFVEAEATRSSPIDYVLPAPPAIAWEYLTSPARRPHWQTGVTDIDEAAAGGRRGVGHDQPLRPRQGRDRRGDPRLAAVRVLHASSWQMPIPGIPKFTLMYAFEPGGRRDPR